MSLGEPARGGAHLVEGRSRNRDRATDAGKAAPSPNKRPICRTTSPSMSSSPSHTSISALIAAMAASARRSTMTCESTSRLRSDIRCWIRRNRARYVR